MHNYIYSCTVQQHMRYGWLGGQKVGMFVGPGNEAQNNAIKLVILVCLRGLPSPGGGPEKRTMSIPQTGRKAEECTRE